MSEDSIVKILRDYGLTDRESEVYLCLSRMGVSKGTEISKTMRMHKAQTYRILKNLQGKGIVESTLEFPTRFEALPFEEVLDLLIRSRREEASFLEDKKDDLLRLYRSSEARSSTPIEKFAVLEGRSNVYSRISQMIEEAKEEILGMTGSLGLIRGYRWGLTRLPLEKRTVRLRILTQISKDNVKVTEEILQQLSHLGVEARHANLASGVCPRFTVKDDDEAVFFLRSIEDSSSIMEQDTGVWTNSMAAVHALRTLFEEMWRSASEAHKKIQEVKTGKPVEETTVIRDPREAYGKFHSIVDSAEEEIIGITSPNGINRILETHPLQQWLGKGVKLHIMAPVNSGNLLAAKKLSKYGQVRHVKAVYVRIAIVDNEHLFQFKAPPSDQDQSIDPMAFFDDMLYSNNPEYVKGMHKMLNDMWKQSLHISEIDLST